MRKFIPIIKNKMNTIDLKEKIANLYKESIKIIDSRHDNHPVRVIQSIKSIIGINATKPLSNLLVFSLDYLNAYNKNDIISNFKDISIPEVITLADLELSLINKDIGKSERYIHYLSKVSDGKHILEFLLEFSIKYNLRSSFVVWSVYKMMLFLGGHNILESLIFSIHCIVNEETVCINKKNNTNAIDLQNYVYNRETFPLFLMYYSILKEDLVRSDNISRYIFRNMCDTFKFSNNRLKYNIYDNQVLEGRKWLNKFLGTIDYKSLNSELIIMIELSRGALKVAQNGEVEMIWGCLNKYLD